MKGRKNIKPDNSTIGGRLKELRIKHHLTINSVAEYLGKTRVTVCRYENSETYPNYTVLISYCHLFHIDPKTLYSTVKEDTTATQETINVMNGMYYHSKKDEKNAEKMIEDLKFKLELYKRINQELERYIEGNQSFIQLEIMDTLSNGKHIIGTNPHDSLYVENGVVYYYNLQNGEGSKYGAYKFVEKEML